MPNALDEQILRESILQSNPNARDQQILRESVIYGIAKARDQQILREVIISVPYAPVITSVTPNFGPPAGGTSVTIVGLNFYSDSTVAFGGVSATSVSYVSNTELTCVTPAHTIAIVNVTVTNPIGTAGAGTGTLVNGYTYRTTGYTRGFLFGF
jgi:hypothetical protein